MYHHTILLRNTQMANGYQNDNIIEVKEEIVSCDKDHPIVYINVPFGKIMRCPYCNQAYKRI